MNSMDMSLPKSVTVRGHEIKRMPLGRYLQALRLLERFPREMAEKLTPTGDLSDALASLKGLDRTGLIRLVLKAIGIVPEQALVLIAELTDIPLQTLIDDAAIGPDGLLEIIDAWLTVNGAENFTRAAGIVKGKVIKLAAAISSGSSGSSRPVSKSAFPSGS